MTSSPAWFVYVVQCSDGSLYTGVATDVDARIEQHNAGRGAKYTRGRRPVKLMYFEPADHRSAALRREIAIKRLKLADKRKLIARAVNT
ncbi:MAG: GIY-YIG nuclease family protein [Gammaproteobacteria bacterium]